jgi:hypothetical protein
VGDRDPDLDPVHWLDLGPDPDLDSDRTPPRSWRWWYALAAAMVLAALLLTRNQRGADPPEPGRAGAAASSGAVSPRSSTAVGLLPGIHPSPPGLAPADSLSVVELERPLLDVPAGWELFGQGEGVVVRIELRDGRVTRTAVPEVAGANRTFFVVGPDQAIVHPTGLVPGYIVRDEKPAAALPPALDQAFSVLPGPDPRHVWAETRAGTGSALSLLTLDGRPAGIQLPIPRGATVRGPDGAGNVLMSGAGGMYDARPDGLHRITSGSLLAVGPTRWLTLECDARYRCASMVTDRGTGQQRTVTTPLDAYEQNLGAISPDGRTAALLQPNGQGTINLHLLDLTTGTVRVTGVTTSADRTGGSRALAWSPDSRWLFATDGNGRLLALSRTGREVRLDVPVGPLNQLALRTASR